MDKLVPSLSICTCLFLSYTSNLGWIWKEKGVTEYILLLKFKGKKEEVEYNFFQFFSNFS